MFLFTLQENSVIEDINLMCNDIGQAGAELLARALHVSDSHNLLFSEQLSKFNPFPHTTNLLQRTFKTSQQ